MPRSRKKLLEPTKNTNSCFRELQKNINSK